MTDGIADAIRDPHVVSRADRLGFLQTPAPGPGGSLPVVRGASRVFETAQQPVANQMAEAYDVAREAEAAAQVAGVTPTPADVDAMDWPGVDLASLTPEQLCRLMIDCAKQMMAMMARAIP